MEGPANGFTMLGGMSAGEPRVDPPERRVEPRIRCSIDPDVLACEADLEPSSRPIELVRRIGASHALCGVGSARALSGPR